MDDSPSRNQPANQIPLINKITNILYYIIFPFMYASMFRTLAGYSRFMLQEERKNNRVLSSFFQNDAYKKFYRGNQALEGVSTLGDFPETNQKVLLTNLAQIHESDLLNPKKVTQIEHKGEKLHYEISAVQYQANNGIQDRLVVSSLKSLPAEVISVFDGHGGDKLSDYCSHHIVQIVEAFIIKKRSKEEYVNDVDRLLCDAMVHAYHKMDTDFYENVFKNLLALGGKKMKSVGTCALTVIVYDHKIYVANAGDSQAIVVSQDSHDNVSFLELNERLSTSNPAQRERLIKQFPQDTDIIVEEKSGSYYIKGRLQPTRALGDYHLKYSHLYKGKGKFNGPYIKSTPDIRIYPLKEEYKRIVVASDGVWDFLKKPQVAEASLQPRPHEKILQKSLARIAELHRISVEEIKDVSATEKRSFHDDISIAVINLGQK